MRLSPFIALLFGLFVTSAIGDRTTWTPHGETEFVGRAIDKANGKPIQGASIIAVYVLGSGGIHEQAHCSVAEFVRSNERGEYVLPYYDGLPPQFLDAFAHRYVWAIPPRTVTKDEQLRWIVRVTAVVDGKVQPVGREGPFNTAEEATKASRSQQDVWLEEFRGSEDEWVLRLRRIASHAGRGCPGKATLGVVGWDAARLAEAEAMPSSPAKMEVVKAFSSFLEDSKAQHPDSAARLLLKGLK